MTETSHKHRPDQRWFAEAYRIASTEHDRSAQRHEKTAEGQPDIAERERQIARDERRNAAVDRRRVERYSSSEPATANSQEPKGVDLAALIGATVAVLLTLAFGAGAWGPLSTIIGSLLLIVLFAFFRRRRISAEQRKSSAEKLRVWESVFVGLALSAVVGLLVAITSAEAIQKWFFSDHGNRFECRSVAVAQATTAVRDLNDTHARKNLLRQLIEETLQPGSRLPKVTEPTDPATKTADAAVKFAFHHEYDAVLGDCLANETLNSLWWIGISSALLTLVWWGWNLIPILRKRFTTALNERSHKSCDVVGHLLTIKPRSTA